MITRHVRWSCDGQAVTLGVDEAGDGPLLLLLPALSSISTRGEMAPLREALSSRFRVVAIDWPGFGDLPRPRLDWSPDMLSGFLDWVLAEIAPRPHAIVAAGHAATYALHHIAAHPGATTRLVLVAPTWRGPFPTMTGGPRPWFARVRAAVDAPIVGPALYALNLSGPVIRKMVGEHVYSDPAWLTDERMAEKRRVATPAGARHSSVRFVTGALDRVDNREAFLDLASHAGVPVMAIWGDETPRRSLAEMEALSQIAGVETARLRRGKLSIHEEFAEKVAAEILPFLGSREPDFPTGQRVGGA